MPSGRHRRRRKRWLRWPRRWCTRSGGAVVGHLDLFLGALGAPGAQVARIAYGCRQVPVGHLDEGADGRRRHDEVRRQDLEGCPLKPWVEAICTRGALRQHPGSYQVPLHRGRSERRTWRLTGGIGVPINVHKEADSDERYNDGSKRQQRG